MRVKYQVKSLFSYYFNHKTPKIDALNPVTCCSGKIRSVMWQSFNFTSYRLKASYKLAIVFIFGACIFPALVIYIIYSSPNDKAV